MQFFDRFPNREHAEPFARSVTEREKLSASVHATLTNCWN